MDSSHERMSILKGETVVACLRKIILLLGLVRQLFHAGLDYLELTHLQATYDLFSHTPAFSGSVEEM